MAQKYCTNCGEQLKEYAIVCSSCGTPVKRQERTENTQQSDRNAEQFEETYTGETAYAEQVFEEDIPRTAPKEKNTFFAIILSFFIPGLGQVYNGNFWKGIAFMIGVPLGTLFLIIPGLAIWLWNMYDAYTDADKVNKGELPYKEPTFWEIIIFLLLPIIIWLLIAFLIIMFFFIITGVALFAF
ncbi:hypothetical protein MmiHf6_16770 [Methanimicrococcus hongohii]|uniref:Zinc-ribbon domain-containing protein n=1 Tax=Methanimicrococcus hongohii TaxID=3028295 RepID=A0AA96VAA2_9EURY|nr:zinc-ribbon domain-containing protein [Methanimicrococcus sp. Hf6]WNY24346.1 hypothetical protein MmiHf6_16770 [Methanimicrococcus sp. Hf6]